MAAKSRKTGRNKPPAKMTSKPDDGIEMEVDITQIKPSRFQTRNFDKAAIEGLRGLADTIREDGLLQRPKCIKTNDKRRPYELVFGERRWRATKDFLGWKRLPITLVDWPDDRIRRAHLNENLQRENLHALEEGVQALELRNSTTPPMEIRELAKHIGKSEREAARLVQLPNLVDKAQRYFREGLITRGHADAVAALSPEVQERALDHCFTKEYQGYDAKKGGAIYEPNLEAPVPIKELTKWIDDNLSRDLSTVPWDLHDETLVPEQGACSTCAFNTAGSNQLLFADAIKGAAICQNADGFRRKMDAFIARQIESLTVGDERPLLLFADGKLYTSQESKDRYPGALFFGEFYEAKAKADKCDYARPAVWLSGKNAGLITKVCVEPSCPSHAGRRVAGGSSRSSSNGRAPVSRAKLNKQNQERFDIKVNDATRLEVFRQAIPTFADGEIDRTWRERMAAEAFVRLPHTDSDVIAQLIGVDLPRDSYEIKKLLSKLAGFADDELARLMYLCAFVHYGSNHGGRSVVDQSLVVGLALERGLNYTLIDAKVRLEQAPKKYKATHETYLEAVTAGEKAALPVVYEATTPKQTGKAEKTPPKAKAAKGKSKKRDTGTAKGAKKKR